jgi:pimeloyl-ACP methyl ester carboxylesterase
MTKERTGAAMRDCTEMFNESGEHSDDRIQRILWPLADRDCPAQGDGVFLSNQGSRVRRLHDEFDPETGFPQSASRAAGVFYFACNMDPNGVKPFEATPTLNRCFARHAKDYAELSATPADFKSFVEDVSLMGRTQPNYSALDLAKISVPVVIVQSELDEFIKREHAEYLARSIPNAEFAVLIGVSHFAPLQRPDQFNAAILEFVARVP